MKKQKQFIGHVFCGLLFLFCILGSPVKQAEAATRTIAIGESTVLSDTNWENATGYTKTWSSSDYSVVGLSSGGTICRVTGLREGMAVVTCHTYAWKDVPTVYLGTDGLWHSRIYRNTYSTDSTYRIMVVGYKTVTFSPNGGSVSETSRKVKSGNTIGSLPKTVRKGYDFLGWYTGATEGTRIEATRICTSNLTCYAHWKKISLSQGTIKGLSAQYKQMSIKTGEISKAEGYEIQYAKSSDMKNRVSRFISGTSLTVTGLKPGTTYYVRLRGWKKDSAGQKVYGSWSKVRSLKLPKIILSERSVTLLPNQTKQLKLQGAKSSIRWSSNKVSVASVSGKGLIRAKKKGSAVITAKSNKISYQCKVKVENPAISAKTVKMLTGQMLALKMSGTTLKASWTSSNTEIAAVSSTGLVSAKKAGNVTIYAKVNGRTFSSKVTIEDARMNTSNLHLLKNQASNLKITGTTFGVTWMSEQKEIAVVDASGKVTGTGKGTVRIIGLVNGKKICCNVTVEDPSLNYSSYTLMTNNYQGMYLALRLNGTTLPVTWSSSDSSIAEVNQSGDVKGLKPGTATIYAKVSGMVYTCKVKVEYPILNTEKIQLQVGETYQLKLTGTTLPYIWELRGDESVAVVSDTGLVKALKPGGVSVFAKVGGVNVACKVSVIGEPGYYNNPLPASQAYTTDVYNESTKLGNFTIQMLSFQEVSDTKKTIQFRITCNSRPIGVTATAEKVLGLLQLAVFDPDTLRCYKVTNKTLSSNMYGTLQAGTTITCTQTIELDGVHTGLLEYRLKTGSDINYSWTSPALTYFVTK